MSGAATQNWWQLTLRADSWSADTLENALRRAGAAVVTLEDAGDQPVLEPLPGETPLWAESMVTGLFSSQHRIAEVKQQLCRILNTQDVEVWRVTDVEDRDWVGAWLDDFHPMRFGERLWICPTQHPPPDPAGVNVRLDPGLAFGTGTHPTTGLCLRWLDGAGLTGCSVVDYGCGSGILAIAAAKLGARRVWAVDIDPQALLATQQNVLENHVSTQVIPVMPEQLPILRVDMLIANILAKPLHELTARFADLVREGGQLVLSGLLASQLGQIETAYSPWFDFGACWQSEDWVLCQAIRKVAV